MNFQLRPIDHIKYTSSTTRFPWLQPASLSDTEGAEGSWNGIFIEEEYKR
ncbi:MAG: hypothetical protein WA874_00450 [Chryseosolibacter sp.]